MQKFNKIVFIRLSKTSNKNNRVSGRDISKIHAMNQIDYLLIHELKKLNGIKKDLTVQRSINSISIKSNILMGV